MNCLTLAGLLLAAFRSASADVSQPPPQAQITPPPILWSPSPELVRKDIFSDIASYGGGIISDIKSFGDSAVGAISSAIAADRDFIPGIPSPDHVQSSLGIDDDQVAALPTQVLNIPSYGNWTDRGWNLRFRANVYKQPNTDEEKLNDLANAFLIDTDVEDLPPDQQAQARNVTASIFVIQQDDEEVRFDLSPANSTGSSGEPGGGGAVTPPGGDQTITFPYKTTEQGDIDDFVQLSDTGLLDGNRTDSPQRLNVHATNASLGNATSYLVPPRGLTIISDIDDILRVTKTWNLKEMMFTTFAKRFEPWGNMPQIYANWSRALPDAHFHYLTTTPEQVTRTYMDFIYRTYPRGSFDTRPFNFSDVSAILSIRRFLLDKIFLTFPERRFVLVGDVSNSDTMKAYPALAQDYPGQVACIFMRNTTATDDSDHFPYNTKGFEGLNQQSYMFFNVPDDLTNLDIEGGRCVNSTVRQNVQFEYQNLPFVDDDSAAPYVKASSMASLLVVVLLKWWNVC